MGRKADKLFLIALTDPSFASLLLRLTTEKTSEVRVTLVACWYQLGIMMRKETHEIPSLWNSCTWFYNSEAIGAFTVTLMTPLEYHGVSNHRQIGCLLKNLFRITANFLLTGPFGGTPPVTKDQQWTSVSMVLVYHFGTPWYHCERHICT